MILRTAYCETKDHRRLAVAILVSVAWASFALMGS